MSSAFQFAHEMMHPCIDLAITIHMKPANQKGPGSVLRNVIWFCIIIPWQSAIIRDRDNAVLVH